MLDRSPGMSRNRETERDRETDTRKDASHDLRSGVSRRTLVRAGVSAIAAPAVLRVIPVNAQSRVIKIGHVSPKTGPLAGFGEADSFILEQVRGILSQGLQSGGRTYQVQIISKDSQSSGSRAAEVASELILGDKVDLILASATPDTTNPVADQAEVNEVPCITTNCPWQPYFFGRKGDPAKGFTWTYHFFWGLEDVIGTAFGRAFRATSDDQSVAQLMGLDNRHVFALAMALSLAVIAFAGVFIAIRTNFDPAIGPARLIFGFEAVIIGGLGSMWGTLAGGIILGVAQAIGAQINPGWQLLAGHLAFLFILALRPEGLFPKVKG